MYSIKLPFALNDDVMATLTLKLDIGKDMKLQAARNGYGPEELQNLVGQRMQEIAQQVAEALGISYDPEPE